MPETDLLHYGKIIAWKSVVLGIMSSDVPDDLDRIADLFSALGHETRLEIAHRLYANRSDSGNLAGMSFAELRDAVGASTEEGFSYHLDELTDDVVRHGVTDSGIDEYTVSPEGFAICSFVHEKLLWEPVEVESPSPVGQACYFCGNDLVAKFSWAEYPLVGIGCVNCEYTYVAADFHSPGITEENVDEVVRRMEQKHRTEIELVRRGVCSDCGGEIEKEIRTELSVIKNDGKASRYLVVGICENCKSDWTPGVGSLVRSHPDVVHFCKERGFDPTTVPVWELEWAVTDRYTTLVGSDPLQVQVTIPCDGDELHVTLDEDAEVVDVSE